MPPLSDNEIRAMYGRRRQVRSFNEILDKHDAHRRGCGVVLALVGEQAGLWVAGEDAQVAGILICDEHPSFGGVEGEVARGLAAAAGARIVGDGSERARGVNAEAHEEVVAAVGEVGEAAIAGEYGVTASVGDFPVFRGVAFGQQVDGL